jgi:large subunit ribosomal protein L9e
MKLLAANHVISIPSGVSIEVKSRAVRVKGPRGTLQKDFKHLGVDMYLVEEDGEKKLKVDLHLGKKKQLASIRTVCSHVQNMITGVTKGFEYKMRLVYAHFPINISIEKKGEVVEIRNFLGEKRVRVVNMLPGVTIARSEAVKDELVLSGNNVENVSRSCALIHQSCLVKKKDIRKFLDGIYVSEKGLIVKEN